MPQEIFRQTNFNGGELSPKAIGRRDLQAYVSSLALCENMIPMAEGPVRRRPGLRHVDLVRNVIEPVPTGGATVTAPNGGVVADLLSGAVMVTTGPIGSSSAYVVAEVDFGAPVAVSMVDLLNFVIVPAGTTGGSGAPSGDPAPPQYPWDRPTGFEL